MEIQNPKCSSSKHSEFNAVSYCPECKKYLCNKCQNLHNELLEDHKTINLNEKKEIFINKCKEKNHNDKLEFYCKDHNILCCVGCTSKFKDVSFNLSSVLTISIFGNLILGGLIFISFISFFLLLSISILLLDEIFL